MVMLMETSGISPKENMNTDRVSVQSNKCPTILNYKASIETNWTIAYRAM